MSNLKKATRKAFRDAVFARDNHRCVMCGASNVALDAHHIFPREDMPNGGYVKENGITLCDVWGGCHARAEATLQGKAHYPGFTHQELFAKINSSLLQAKLAASTLKTTPRSTP